MENNLGLIERGIINSVNADGYIVESLDRDGIVSPALPAMSGGSFSEGDAVLFVLFRDGTGMILCEYN